jgi:hypothetical protein
MRAIATAVFPYGAETFDHNFFYAIDYVAGYENSDEVPEDLRETIGKIAAVSLLNIIGDGLMAALANMSSSIGMDGLSESSSVGTTSSATSAMFGARIKVYEDEIDDYLTKNKWKFNTFPMGGL